LLAGKTQLMTGKKAFAERVNELGWDLFRLGPSMSQFHLAQGGRIVRPVFFLTSTVAVIHGNSFASH